MEKVESTATKKINTIKTEVSDYFDVGKVRSAAGINDNDAYKVIVTDKQGNCKVIHSINFEVNYIIKYTDGTGNKEYESKVSFYDRDGEEQRSVYDCLAKAMGWCYSEDLLTGTPGVNDIKNYIKGLGNVEKIEYYFQKSKSAMKLLYP